MCRVRALPGPRYCITKGELFFMLGHMRQTGVAVKENQGGNGGRKELESFWWASPTVVTVKGKLFCLVIGLVTQERGGCVIPGGPRAKLLLRGLPLKQHVKQSLLLQQCRPACAWLDSYASRLVCKIMWRERDLQSASLALHYWPWLCEKLFGHPRKEIHSYVVPRRE